MASPIKLKSHRIFINAPRELVYQTLSAFGRGKVKFDNNESSRVICRDGDTIIAEFVTKAGPFRYKSIEKVTLEKPERIAFEHLSGPLAYVQEEFVFNDLDGNTELIHNGEFIWKRIPFFGRLGGLLYTKRAFESVIEEHMEQMKQATEARAARSHVFRRKQADTEVCSST